jgi:ferrous iron transport protein B
VIAGFAAVINFLPQLIVLFYCMAFLEASGYMNRIAFFLDKIFKNSAYPANQSSPSSSDSGCSVPGVMSARTVENEKERNLTIVDAVYPLLRQTADHRPFERRDLPGLWLGDFPQRLFLGHRHHLNHGFDCQTPAEECTKKPPSSANCPSYKWPNQRYYAWREVFEKSVSFFKRAGTVIFLCSFYRLGFDPFQLGLAIRGPTYMRLMARI